jgi:SAM-dependent methyltransferase
MTQDRYNSEIGHGHWLLQNNPELQWGWGTPAGKLRARRRAELIAGGAGLKPGVKAMEVGCGTGMFTKMFAATGADILAVDISGDLLSAARARGLPAKRIAFHEGPFEECHAFGPFDAVIGSSVLHHLNLDVVFGQIFSLLKPGGILSFAEPNMLNPQVWFTLSFRRFFPYVSPDETAFTRWNLEKRLSAAGFTDITVTPFDWLHPSTPDGMIGLVKTLEGVVERAPGAREFAGSLYLRAARPI